MTYSKLKNELKFFTKILTNVDCCILAILLKDPEKKFLKLDKKEIMEQIPEEEKVSEKYFSNRLLELAKSGYIKRKREKISFVYWTSINILKNALIKSIGTRKLFQNSNDDSLWLEKKQEIIDLLGVKEGNLFPCIEGYTSLDVIEGLKKNAKTYDIFIFSLLDSPPPVNYTESFFQIFKTRLIKGQLFRIRRIVHKNILNSDSFYSTLYRNEINFIHKILKKYNLNSPQETSFTYEIGIFNEDRIMSSENFPVRKPLSFFGVHGIKPDEGIIGFFTYSLRDYLMKNQAHFIKSQFTFQFIGDLFENLWILTKKIAKDSVTESFNFITVDDEFCNENSKRFSLLEF